MATVSEYGTWKSPITADLATAANASISPDIHFDGDTVFFLELRPAEKGRYVVCSWKVGDAGCKEWTPAGFSCRTTIHEYGGGSFHVAGGNLFFCNFSDQRVYCQTAPGEDPKPVTPDGRYADGSYCSKLGLIYYVKEDHSVVTRKEKTEPENSIVIIESKGFKQKTLVSGADFYSSPRVSPDATKIAWVQWFHPNMPWDATELHVGELGPAGDQIVGSKKVDLGQGLNYMQPTWTRDNQLLFICDPKGWWNLHQYDVKTETTQCLIDREDEVGFPQWVFGIRAYVQAPGDEIVTTYKNRLGVYNVRTKAYREVDTGFGYVQSVVSGADGCVYAVAGDPTRFFTVIKVSLADGKVELVKEATTLTIDEGYISVPKHVTYPTTEGDVSHAYFYAPKNKDFAGPASSLPPLLVCVHGGPTACCNNVLKFATQYFTSRGFAVLDVNYRGSTGYGTPYRNRLRDKWGVYDLDDCCQGALYLVNQKLVDPNRLCIDGGSAGGYTTLACLAFRDIFKAGVSHYGVSDLGALARDTHKFESRYLDLLIGPYPAAEKVYNERSPIFSVDTLNCPLAFFQGGEDKIVLPDQAERMYEAVKSKGLPAAYVLFPNEQHGFRDGANRKKALTGEFYFYSRIFGFQPADADGEIEIVNLSV